MPRIKGLYAEEMFHVHIIQIVGRPGTGSLPSTIAPPDHPL